jgi:hypothetical protein
MYQVPQIWEMWGLEVCDGGITILRIIHRSVFYLKIQLIGDWILFPFRWNLLRLAQLRTSLCLRTPTTTAIGFIKPTQHNPSKGVKYFHFGLGPTRVELVLLLGFRRQRLALPVWPIWAASTWRRRQNPVSEMLRFKQKTGRWIMSRIVIVILVCHRHKPIDSINLLGSLSSILNKIQGRIVIVVC